MIYEERWLNIKDNTSLDLMLVARWALTMEWIYDVENMGKKLDKDKLMLAGLDWHLRIG